MDFLRSLMLIILLSRFVLLYCLRLWTPSLTDSVRVQEGSRTLEAPCGNCYALARGMRLMMMMMITAPFSNFTLVYER